MYKRQPLTTLIGYLDAAHKGLVTGKDRDDYIETARRKAHDLKEYIDVLFLSLIHISAALGKVARALQKHHRKALTPQGRQSVKKLMNHYGCLLYTS